MIQATQTPRPQGNPVVSGRVGAVAGCCAARYTRRTITLAASAANYNVINLVLFRHVLPVRVVTAPFGFVDKGTPRILERLVTRLMMMKPAS